MKHIIFDDPFLKKKSYSLDIDQLSILRNINKDKDKDNDKDSEPKEHNEFIIELKKKYNAYKQQDKNKSKFDEDKYISFDAMIQKIIDSNLKCYYCNCDLLILFNKKRDGVQWTLERLNNNLGHYDSNTCIACLKCNLKRRTDSHEYFKKGKQLQLLKIN